MPYVLYVLWVPCLCFSPHLKINSPLWFVPRKNPFTDPWSCRIAPWRKLIVLVAGWAKLPEIRPLVWLNFNTR